MFGGRAVWLLGRVLGALVVLAVTGGGCGKANDSGVTASGGASSEGSAGANAGNIDMLVAGETSEPARGGAGSGGRVASGGSVAHGGDNAGGEVTRGGEDSGGAPAAGAANGGDDGIAQQPGQDPGLACFGAHCDFGEICLSCHNDSGGVCAPDPRRDLAGYMSATAVCSGPHLVNECDDPQDCKSGYSCTAVALPLAFHCTAEPAPEPVNCQIYNFPTDASCTLCWTDADCPATEHCADGEIEKNHVRGCQPNAQ